MERPSHINLRTSHTFSSRLALLGAAISLPLVIAWAFDHGMVGQAFRSFGPMIMVPVDQPVKPRTPPPAPKLMTVEQPKIDQPLIQIAPDQKDNGITASVSPVQVRQPDQTATPVAAGPDRAAIGITATHTIPPYPLLAQRLGKEGKVTLRLTVLPDGRVGKADIVTSSGSTDLDASAQDWIVAHWTYKPALDKGQPAPSQTLATVLFSLSDQR